MITIAATARQLRANNAEISNECVTAQFGSAFGYSAAVSLSAFSGDHSFG
jgi:hypothetical protein